MKERRFVKYVMPSLVKEERVVVLVQNSVFSVVLLCLAIDLIRLGVDNFFISKVEISGINRWFCCVRTASCSSAECV